MRIGVTAASGQLARAIIKAASALVGQADVVGIARTPANAEGQGVEIRPGDYRDQAALEGAFKGVDAAFLVSGNDAPDKRIGQHRNVIAAAKAAGVRKLVYSSIQGAEEGTAFSPIVQSNRQTERDIVASGLDYAIGRNGIYIEPDVEYIDHYRQAGEIANCAGKGRCGYTTRPELGYAFARMLTGSAHNGKTYNLHGEALTQAQLVAYLNDAFGTRLVYRPLSVDAYREERVAELGPFLGTIIAGIYEGIALGAADNPSDYATAAGRAHQTWPDYFARIKAASSR